MSTLNWIGSHFTTLTRSVIFQDSILLLLEQSYWIRSPIFLFKWYNLWQQSYINFSFRNLDLYSETCWQKYTTDISWSDGSLGKIFPSNYGEFENGEMKWLKYSIFFIIPSPCLLIINSCGILVSFLKRKVMCKVFSVSRMENRSVHWLRGSQPTG